MHPVVGAGQGSVLRLLNIILPSLEIVAGKDSSNLKTDDSGVKVSRKKLVGDKPAVQQVEKNVVVVPGGKGERGSGGKGSSSFGGRGGKSSGGRGRGGGKGGRGNNPRGPPAVSS